MQPVRPWIAVFQDLFVDSPLNPDHTAHVRRIGFPSDGNTSWRPIGAQSLDFLYRNREIDTRVDAIELLPGVACCLRQFHALITAVVHGAWAEFVRKYNRDALANTAELTEFLFGSERSSLVLLRPALVDLQGGQCFYCGDQLRTPGHVDHFIPWSRYPIDLGHNLVVAHDSCNNAKGSLLAAEKHLSRWVARNRSYSEVIQSRCSATNIAADASAATQIARWAYGQAFSAGILVRPLGCDFRNHPAGVIGEQRN